MDEFGRTIPEATEESAPSPPPPAPPANPIPPKRQVIDTEVDLNVGTLSPDNKRIAKKITAIIVTICNPSARLTNGDIVIMSTTLFKDHSKNSDILLPLFTEAIVRMSPQVECLAALIGCYCEKFYKSYEETLIQNILPSALVAAFKRDHFRVVKLILRFLGAFVQFGIASASSYVQLLHTLADMLPKGSQCRGENIARAIIVAIKMVSSSNLVSQEEMDDVIEKIKQFVANRPPDYIQTFSPIKGHKKSILDLLITSQNFPSLAEPYLELFQKKEESEIPPEPPKDIPLITFEFGEIDIAPFPLVLLESQTVAYNFFPVLADIADDILVYFGNDASLATDQLLGLPMLLGYPSLKKKDSDTRSHFIVSLFNNVIMADLLRIPESYYPPAFHVSLLFYLIKLRDDIIQSYLSPIILDLVKDIGNLDIGAYNKLILFFAHHLSNYSFSWCWDQWLDIKDLNAFDLKYLFLRDVITQCYYIANPEIIKSMLSQNGFASILPPSPIGTCPYKQTDNLYQKLQLLKETMDQNMDEFDTVYAEINGQHGGFTATELFIVNIFMNGKGECEQTVQEIEKYSTYIRKFFDEEYMKELLIHFTYQYFGLIHPVMQQIITYFLLNQYVSVTHFVKWFFDPNADILNDTTIWPVFISITSCMMAMYKSERKYDEMKDIMKEIFDKASDFIINKTNVPAIAEKFFYGCLKEYGRRYYNVFTLLDDEMNQILAKDKLPEEFKDVIKEITLIAHQ